MTPAPASWWRPPFIWCQWWCSAPCLHPFTAKYGSGGETHAGSPLLLWCSSSWAEAPHSQSEGGNEELFHSWPWDWLTDWYSVSAHPYQPPVALVLSLFVTMVVWGAGLCREKLTSMHSPLFRAHPVLTNTRGGTHKEQNVDSQALALPLSLYKSIHDHFH